MVLRSAFQLVDSMVSERVVWWAVKLGILRVWRRACLMVELWDDW